MESNKFSISIRNKQGIGVGLTSKSRWPAKPSIVLVCFVLSCLVFKGADVIGFSFAPNWFLKMSKLLCEFHQFIVGWKWWLACFCDWQGNCFGFGCCAVAFWKLHYIQSASSMSIAYIPCWCHGPVECESITLFCPAEGLLFEASAL